VRASRAANQDPVQRGNELLNLSQDQNEQDHGLALTTALEALTLLQPTDDKAGVARAYYQIARCHHALSNLTEATSNYQEALKLFQDLHNSGDQAETLIMLAYVEQRKAEWLNAIAYYDQAQTLIQNDPARLARIASGMADLFNENGLPEQALVQYQRALDYFREAGDQYAVNRMIMFLGYTKFLDQKYPEALANLQEALATFEPYSLSAAQCHEYLGRVYLALKDYPAALEHLQPVLSFYERTRNVTEAEGVRLFIAQVYEAQGSFALARSRYLQALSVFRRFQDRISEAGAYFALGRLELKAGHLPEAETYLKQSIDTTEYLRSVSVGRDVTTGYSASVHDRYQAYITCLLRRSKLEAAADLSEQAFQASELSRGRALFELLRDTQTNLLAGVDPHLAEREKTLRQAISAKMNYRLDLLATKYKQSELSAVENSLERLHAEHQQLYQQLRNLNPAYGQITQPSVWPLQQIQQEVIDDDQTALVEYFLADEASYVWVVTRNDIKFTELAGEDTITKAVQNAHRLLAAQPKDVDATGLSKALEDVAALVINPIADQLSARRIIIVADGALHYLPFQALPLPSDKQPLIASREIVNAPSASILGQLRQEKLKRTTPENVVAAFGYPAFPSNYAELRGNSSGGDLIATVKSDRSDVWSSAMRDIEVSGSAQDLATIQPLIHTREELAKLREVAGPASFFATGFSASRETLEHTDLAKYAILHFATHGVLDPKSPEKSGFLLSTVGTDGRPQNGFITLQDVYKLQAPVSLVVLSACSTGLGKDVRGEGLISVTRGFMYAGASSVAATLWNVNDDATAELMKHFYTNMLQEGMTPAAALSAAQNRIRQQPQWRSPHYWAAFTLQGEYQQPAKLPSSSVFTARRIIIGVVILLLLGSVGWWSWRKRQMRLRT
jgi:CHAT domain-containing protein